MIGEVAGHPPMKMMEGDCARAWANKSLTRAGPTPTNISIKSDPAMDRKGTLASPAVALAAHHIAFLKIPKIIHPFTIIHGNRS